MSEQDPIAQALVFAERWRNQDPALRLAEVYAADPGWMIATALYMELAECVFRIAEPQVREAKLGWWVEEVAHYADGAARHPLTLALQQRRVSARSLRALVVGAAGLLDAAAAESREDLQRQRQALLSGLAELMLEAQQRSPDAATDRGWMDATALLDDCFRLYSIGRQGAQAVPILSLAEHAELGLSRSQMGEMGEAELAPIRRRLSLHLPMPAPLPLPPLGVYLALWRAALRRRGSAPGVGATAALRAWRTARRWRHVEDR